MPKQDCPLCGKKAFFSGQDYGKRKAFHCKTCAEFIITLDAESKLEKSPPKWKPQLSEKAQKAPAGKILVIRITDRHQPNAQNVETLRGEYEPLEN